MDYIISSRPLWAVAISLIGAAGILLAGRIHRNLRETITFVVAFAKLGIIVSMLPSVRAGTGFETRALEIAPGFSLHLRTDELGMIFALLASVLWILTSIYSIGYMRSGDYSHQTGYFASFAVCLSSAIGIAFAANLVTLFIFYEILTLATYPLVVHRRNKEAIAGGRKYLAYTLIAGQLFLAAILWSGSLAPGAEMRPGGYLAGTGHPVALSIIFLLFIAGVGVKAGLMPFHAWLPAAMVAPTPVSALLHAVAVVKAGCFATLRIVGFVFGVDLLSDLGMDHVLAAMAGTTIVLGSVRALGEDHLKRRLAYSTVSQLSYIVLGAALGSLQALAGAMFHIVAHGFMKITLFFCAGSIYTKTHKEYIRDLAGLGRSMPATFVAFTIGSLGLAGMPLMAGFVSKWQLGMGALAAGSGMYVGILVLSGLLNFAYFFPIVHTGFFGKPEAPFRFDEAGKALWVPLVVTAAISVLLGVNPDAFLGFWELAQRSAEHIVFRAPLRLAD